MLLVGRGKTQARAQAIISRAGLILRQEASMRVRVSTLRRFVRKALREHSEGHQGRDFDHAPGYSSDADMARTQLKNIAARASKLHSSLKDDDDLPAWVLSKMAVADSYMTSLSDYLHGEIDRMQEDPEYTSEYEYSEDDDDSEEEMDSDDIEGALSSMLGGMEDSMDYDEESGYEDDYEGEEDEDMEGYGDPDMPEDDEDSEDDEDEDMEDYGDPEMPEEDDETGEEMPQASN